MNSEFMLSQGAGQKLEFAVQRNGGTTSDFDWLSTSENFKSVILLARGEADLIIKTKPIAELEVVIDFDKVPSIPIGWSIPPDAEQLPHRVRGQVKIDITKVGLYLDDVQKNGKWIAGNKLRKKLADVPVYGAQLLDFYLANPHLIPEKWKGKAVFFWGTIFRGALNSLGVRCLWGGNGPWRSNYCWLGNDWHPDYPAALSVS